MEGFAGERAHSVCGMARISVSCGERLIGRTWSRRHAGKTPTLAGRSPFPRSPARRGEFPDGQNAPKPCFFRDTPKYGAPLCSAFARRANSVERAHRQRPLPGRARQRRIPRASKRWWIYRGCPPCRGRRRTSRIQAAYMLRQGVTLRLQAGDGCGHWRRACPPQSRAASALKNALPPAPRHSFPQLRPATRAVIASSSHAKGGLSFLPHSATRAAALTAAKSAPRLRQSGRSRPASPARRRPMSREKGAPLNRRSLLLSDRPPPTATRARWSCSPAALPWRSGGRWPCRC